MNHAKTVRTSLVIGTALCLTACGALTGAGGANEGPSAYPWDGAQEPVQAPLLSRDGGVVAGPGAGTTDVTSPRHGVQTSDEGRMYIVELYQKALDERDSLRVEVDGLMAVLGQTQEEAAALSAELERERAEVARLRVEIQSVSGENVELAARLATAQLRRLEAEKLLLEERLHAQSSPPPADGTQGELAAEPSGGTGSGEATPSAWDLALGGGGQ
jgi:hypothetical protein